MFVARIGDAAPRPVAVGPKGNEKEAVPSSNPQIAAGRAMLRFARHYSERLGSLGQQLGRGGEEAASALRSFDRDRENFLAALALIQDRVGSSRPWNRLAARAIFGAEQLLSLRLKPRARLTWFQSQLRGARLSDDRLLEGETLDEIGMCLRRLGEIDDAIIHHDQAGAIFRQLGAQSSEAVNCHALGTAYAESGHPRRAMDFYRRELALLEGIGNRNGMTLAHIGLGMAHIRLREPDEALQLFTRAHALALEFNDAAAEISSLGNIGRALHELGRSEEALEAQREQHSRATALGLQADVANAMLGIALSLRALGRRAGLANWLSRALVLSRASGDQSIEAIILSNLAIELWASGQSADAVRAARNALMWFQQVRDPAAEDVRRLLADWNGDNGRSISE